MDYWGHYQRLVDRARDRVLSGYCERHHVVPRCLGGGDEPENIVRLTAEEHYVAHQLLVKMHPGNVKLLWAWSAMTHAPAQMPHRSNKRYGWLRRKFAEAMRERYSGRPLSEEQRAKLSAAHTGKKYGPRTAEQRARMSAASKGKPKSTAHREALSRAKIGTKVAWSDERRANHTAAIRTCSARVDRSYMQTDEYRKARSEQMKRVWAERKQRG